MDWGGTGRCLLGIHGAAAIGTATAAGTVIFIKAMHGAASTRKRS